MNWVIVLVASIIVTGVSVRAHIENDSDLEFLPGLLAF